MSGWQDAGFYDSLVGSPGEACPSSFSVYLECRNAVITARKLPALIAFETFMIDSAKLSLEPIGTPWRRIREQILSTFPKTVVASARSNAGTAGDLTYLPAKVVAA